MPVESTLARRRRPRGRGSPARDAHLAALERKRDRRKLEFEAAVGRFAIDVGLRVLRFVFGDGTNRAG